MTLHSTLIQCTKISLFNVLINVRKEVLQYLFGKSEYDNLV